MCDLDQMQNLVKRVGPLDTDGDFRVINEYPQLVISFADQSFLKRSDCLVGSVF